MMDLNGLPFFVENSIQIRYDEIKIVLMRTKKDA